jgi:putative ABC transport system permease protein
VTAATALPNSCRTGVRLPLAFTIALRELRAGLGGLAVFVFCIALGVAAVAAIGSLAASFDKALARQGRLLVGGDLSFERVHRRAETDERAALDAEGLVSESASLRAMARSGTSKSVLVEVKAVDPAYPLYGEVAVKRPPDAGALWRKTGVILVERTLLDRLGVDVGSRLTIGDAEVEIGGILGEQPDRLADRLAYGPKVLMSLDTLERTGLVQPGSIVRWTYRLKLPGDQAQDKESLALARTSMETKFPQSGFDIRDWTDPAPSIRRDARRFTQFIGLVGLTALLLGGIGVGGAVGGYMAKKRKIIATFKCLGASSKFVLAVYAIETLILGSIGIALGLLVGALTPAALASAYRDVLPLPLAVEPHPLPLLTAALAGLLTVALFVLWPLGRAARVPAAVLMRQELAEQTERPAFGFLAGAAASGIALFALGIAASGERLITASISVGIVAAFLFFLGFGWGLKRLAARLRRSRAPELALALASIGGPGSLARSVAVALGLGLGLLVAVALIHRSLTAELQGDLQTDAPAYYFLDIDANDVASFRDTVLAIEPDAKLADAPMLRGRIVAVKGVPSQKAEVSPDYRWVLNGDRGLTYTETLPGGSELVEGEWWPANYSGPPLVSFDAEAARGLGLKLGDSVTVNILGRNVEARIASLRKIDWESLAINFVMVFSPNTLTGAPHRVLVTLELPKNTDPGLEGKLIQALAENFPLITAIKVGDIVEAARELLAKVMTAIRVTAALTLLIGAAVLASAIAAGQERRKYHAVLYKTLGATRGRIIRAELLEFGLLGLATAAASVLLATITAWALCKWAFEVKFVFSISAAAETVALALALVLGFGAIATWRVLSVKAATYLRDA